MRLDTELAGRNLYPSRAKAAATIKAGLVRVNGVSATKASMDVSNGDSIAADPLPYISGRGGLKLAKALDEFKINPAGMLCLDAGASTGGFTEVLLNRGAKRVIAVDIGSGQMIPELKNDPRVLSLEKTDIRALKPLHKADLIVADVSFISLTNISSNLAEWNPRHIIALIKPQFEAPRHLAAKSNGVIKSRQDRLRAIAQVANAFDAAGFERAGLIESPIKGGSGNTEYLALFNARQ